MFNSKEYYKIYYQLHKDDYDGRYSSEYQKQYRLAHKEERKQYRQTHKEEIRQREKLKQQKSRKNNINFKIRYNLRARIWDALNRNIKSQKTLELLGCSVEQLKQHLENKFAEGMSWSNYGSGKNGKGKQEWHIDHILPCASFDLSKPEEQSKCFHYSNLQPLWAYDNIIKSNKIL